MFKYIISSVAIASLLLVTATSTHAELAPNDLAVTWLKEHNIAP